MRNSWTAASSSASPSGSGSTSATVAPNGTNHPTYEAKLSVSSMFVDPGRWPAANSARGRPSTTCAPAATAAANAAASSCGGTAGRPSTGGPARLIGAIAS